MPKHIHAELMAQYAADAMETDKPWERWETRLIGRNEWQPVRETLAWAVRQEYRRKSATVMPVEPLPAPLRCKAHVQMPHPNGLPLSVDLLFRNKAQLDAWVKFFDAMPEGF